MGRGLRLSAPAGILVFARMNSARLPGKALCDFGGMPLLAWVLRRARGLPFPVFLASSTQAADDALVELADREGVASFRGPLDDVLGRALAAARHFGLDTLARLCGDRPYFDTRELTDALGLAIAQTELDLVSNYIPARTAPGLTTEVVGARALARADACAVEREDREHLTRWFYRHAADLRIRYLESEALRTRGNFAVDTRADLDALRPCAGWDPSIALAEVIPVLARRNAAEAGA